MKVYWTLIQENRVPLNPLPELLEKLAAKKVEEPEAKNSDVSDEEDDYGEEDLKAPDFYLPGIAALK